MRKGEKMTDSLPYIAIRKTKMSPAGHTMEEVAITVQGNNLKECKVIFDNLYKPKEKPKIATR